LRNIVFLGHIADREMLADYYANADIFVHPNPREPFGIAPLEAMAAGAALVAPDAGGVTSYADASNAWLAEATPAAFARAVLSVRSDPAGAAKKLALARKKAQEHSWDNAASRYLSLYRQLDAITQGHELANPITPRTYSTTGDS
jgi:alpha-1,6-mannosyltransferase